MDTTGDHVMQAQGAEYWGRYQWLQGLWRMGERLTLARWGRTRQPDMREAQVMRQLGQEVAALLVGFDGYQVEVERMDVVQAAQLTAGERDVLLWLSRGYDVRGVAERLCYGREVIYARLRSVREKLGTRTEAGAVIEGLRLGIINMPSEEEMRR